MHVEQVTDPRVQRRDHVWLTVALEAEVADERSVEDLVDPGAVVDSAIVHPLDAGPGRWGCGGACHGQQPNHRPRLTWSDGAILGQMPSRIGCDVVVVGGGSSGCVVAGRVASESDAAVLLVEAGPDYGARSSGRWPADLLDGGALVTSHDWGYGSGELPGRDPIAFPRARVIGGCSSHNGCVVAVGCPADYDGWAVATGDDRWAADAIRPALARSLSRLAVRTYAEDEVGPFHRVCLDAAAALGLPRVDDLADLDGGTGFGIEPVNVDVGVRVNAAFAYLDPARSRSNLRILGDALCDRIVFSNGGGAEVVVVREGEEVHVTANTVVLSAGAYGSPAILQRSGVGDPAELRAVGIAPSLELPGVGRNLHDHPLVELEFAGSERLRTLLAESTATRFTPEEQTLGKLRSSRAVGPYDVHLFPIAAHPNSLLEGRVMLVVAALEPRSRGALRVVDAGPLHCPGDRARLPHRRTGPRPRCAGRGNRVGARARGD